MVPHSYGMLRIVACPLLLIALYPFITQGTLMDSLIQCCKIGKDEVNKNTSCTNIRGVMSAVQVHLQSRSMCNYIGAVCCENQLRNVDCTNGIEAARTSGICSTDRSNDHQKCCELCKIGMRIGSQGEECSLGTARLGEIWDAAFIQCCDLQSPDDRPDQIPEPPDLGNVCELLRGELCEHTCIPNGNSYRCACHPGYVLLSDQKTCAQPTSPRGVEDCGECSDDCINGENGPQCTCPEGMLLASDNKTCLMLQETTTRMTCPRGFRLAYNGTDFCQDIDECAEKKSNCDLDRQKCVNTEGSYNCLALITPLNCRRGLIPNLLHQRCDDVDECLDKEDPPCDSNQYCENTYGSYKCFCKEGFRQDPITLACMDVNECQLNTHSCGPFQRCDNTMGSYACVRDINCGTGYTLNSESNKCEDDDECALGTHHCGYLGSNFQCVNTQGSFRCVRVSPTTPPETIRCTSPSCRQPTRVCPTGFRIIGDNCIDINECGEGIANCRPNQKCINIKGHYLCSEVRTCGPGFRMNSDFTRCIDINECAEQRRVCMHSCYNLYGSFACRCDLGYKLGPDNRTCIDINECEIGRRCQGLCYNELGTYRCDCPAGYTLSSNQYTCLDINECDQGRLCQEEDEVCVNIPGSHRCGSIACPPGYRRDPNRKSKCYKNMRCPWHDTDCLKQPDSYSYNFITIVSNYTLPLTGYINMFAVDATSNPLVPDFTYDVVQARVPPGVEAATKSNFNLLKQYGRATLQLVRPVYGPQDIQIDIKTEFFTRSSIQSHTIHRIEIYVSQYNF